MTDCSDKKKLQVAVIGASGYTGIELMRLLYRHPHVEVKALVAQKFAKKNPYEVFNQFSHLKLPPILTEDELNYQKIDVVFSALPHGTSQYFIKKIPPNIRIIDLSADFRLDCPVLYEKWYDQPHIAVDMLKDSVYGLTEHCANKLPEARLVACPGCYPTAVLLALIPVIEGDMVEANDIIIDAKSGISGAGRSLNVDKLFCEVNENIAPYSIGRHRHMAEIQQQLTQRANQHINISFTPHLVPMSRGELVTCYVKLKKGNSISDLIARLSQSYRSCCFVRILPAGQHPVTAKVRGSNFCDIGVFQDNIPQRAIIIAAIDNLVKGSSGQAIQNFNLMHGFAENCALEQLPLFP